MCKKILVCVMACLVCVSLITETFALNSSNSVDADIQRDGVKNYYSGAQQTIESISPHYYVNGAQYTDTKYDASYNCTAPIEVEPNTTYTMGYVPSISQVLDYVVEAGFKVYDKPWAGSTQGVFFYDENGDYISKTSELTFTTPENTETIRFNYFTYVNNAYSVTLGCPSGLELLNAHLMIVEGTVLPDTYVAGAETADDNNENNENNENNLIYYEVQADSSTIQLSAKYTSTTDIQYVLGCGGGNNLFDFRNIYLFDNSDTPIVHDTTDVTKFLRGGSDWHAPFIIKAINNIDGDLPNSGHFTGGNHGYNNSGTGSTATARSASVEFFADGEKVTSGAGFASEIEMRWTNYVQATNTKKEDGSGREVLCENHVMVFDGEKFSTYVELVPLEDVTCVLWYGLQAMINAYSQVCYVDGKNSEPYEATVASGCGDKAASMFKAYNDNGDTLEVSLDTTFGLGTRSLCRDTTNGIFTSSYGKSYFTIMNNSSTLSLGEKYELRGEYRFYSQATHNFGEWIIDKEATCTENGLKHKKCTECREVLEEIVYALGHSESGWIVDASATVNAPGSKHKECTECGELLETATIAQLKCSAPKSGKVQNTASGVKVTWGKVSGADKYRLYRKVKGGSWAKVADTTSTSYTDKTAKSGVTYYYTVKAFNEAGGGSYNKTGLAIRYVATPTLKKIENATTSVKITWSKVAGADGYYVYRKAAGATSWTKIANVKNGLTTSYKDTKVSSGKNYTYTVRAYDGKTLSSFISKGISIKFLATPKLSKVTSTKSGVTVKWGKVTGASGYIVYRKTGSGSWVKMATIKGNSKVSYLDKTAKKGKTYTYTVKAYSGDYRSYYNTKGLKIKDKY